MEKTACSLCGSLDAHPVLILQDYGYSIPGQFLLVRCRNCGLLYLTPRPQPEEMAQYYPADYAPYKTAIEDEKWGLMRWVRRRNIGKYRQLVERYAPDSPKSILDLGCSTGIFLADMRSAGWQVQGIEMSHSAAAYACERFGLDITEGRLPQVYQEIEPEKFSVATLWDVLEHTYDPLQTLCILNALLVPGGTVVLTVPHWESWDRRLFGDYWIGYDAPRHLFVFTREVLKKMLNKAGYEIVAMKCGFGGYYSTLPSIQHWANTHINRNKVRFNLFRLLSIPGLRYLCLPYDATLDLLGLGNKLLVVARKTRPVDAITLGSICQTNRILS